MDNNTIQMAQLTFNAQYRTSQIGFYIKISMWRRLLELDEIKNTQYAKQDEEFIIKGGTWHLGWLIYTCVVHQILIGIFDHKMYWPAAQLHAFRCCN